MGKQSVMIADDYKITFTNFRNQYFTVEELLKERESRHLQEKPREFRLAFSDWSVEQRSRFVESLIVGQPHPAFFIDGSLNQWYLIDGEKRLRAISRFVSDAYRLCGLFFLGDKYEGRTFSELPLFIRRKIMNYVFEAYILNPGSSPQVRYGVYTYLLARPQRNVTNNCRRFIFPEGFQLLSGSYLPGNQRNAFARTLLRFSMRGCSWEDLAGRLFVSFLSMENIRFSSSGHVNIEVLVNSLLEEPHVLSDLMEFYGLRGKFVQAVDFFGLQLLGEMKTVEQVDTLLILTLMLKPNEWKAMQVHNWKEQIEQAWQMMPEEMLSSHLLNSYLKRSEFVYHLVKS